MHQFNHRAIRSRPWKKRAPRSCSDDEWCVTPCARAVTRALSMRRLLSVISRSNDLWCQQQYRSSVSAGLQIRLKFVSIPAKRLETHAVLGIGEHSRVQDLEGCSGMVVGRQGMHSRTGQHGEKHRHRTQHRARTRKRLDDTPLAQRTKER